MFHIILTHRGWVRNRLTQEVTRFASEENAVSTLTPMDVPYTVIPVETEQEFDEYMSGAKRTPILNKSGLR